MRVLLVDDVVEVARLKEQLGACGINAVSMSNGDDALRLWRVGAWDLVVTELWIAPGEKIRDGKELVMAIRARDPHQRIAICTADRGVMCGPCPIFFKPCPVERLIGMLRRRPPKLRGGT